MTKAVLTREKILCDYKEKTQSSLKHKAASRLLLGF